MNRRKQGFNPRILAASLNANSPLGNGWQHIFYRNRRLRNMAHA